MRLFVIPPLLLAAGVVVALVSLYWEYVLVGAIFLIGGAIAIWFLNHWYTQKKLAEVQQISRQLQLSVGRHFDVKSCDRCHENKMLVVSINSNGKSVRYRCGFCRKTAYACATSPDSIEALHHAQKLSDAVGVDYQSASATRIVKIPKNLKIFVAASERPMPYEKDSRNTKKKTKKKARRAPRAKH